MPANRAAWLAAAKSKPLEGSDIAGAVVELGSAVTRFKTGDRIVGLACGVTSNNLREGAFQTYTVLQDHMASQIPTMMSYESAAVIPLGLATATCGLLSKDQLALQYPSLTPNPTSKSLLIWGGATSVGMNAIQLAVAAGYEVITTSSPKNFELMRTFGASMAFDYSSPTVAKDIIEFFKGKIMAGVLAIGNVATMRDGSVAAACLEIVEKSKGNKFVSVAGPFDAEKVPAGISAKFILSNSIKNNEVGPAIFVDYLPKALAEEKFVAAPGAVVARKGLESIQAGFEMQKQGVSAKKVVVSL